MNWSKKTEHSEFTAKLFQALRTTAKSKQGQSVHRCEACIQPNDNEVVQRKTDWIFSLKVQENICI